MNKLKNTIILLFVLISPISSYCGGLDISGQLSFSGFGFYSQDNFSKLLGLRYLPAFTYTEYLSDNIFVDSDIELNTFFNSDFSETDQNIKLYRLKFRFAAPQDELQIGLQKINFGPAYILRALRWFDRVDPRDPIGLTEGVYAVRFKHNFLNNSSIMLWGLYRNRETKGYDLLPTSQKRPELGGRVLFPCLTENLLLRQIHELLMLRSLNTEKQKEQLTEDGTLKWDCGSNPYYRKMIQTFSLTNGIQ